MCLNLGDYRFNIMVTTRQKSIINTHTKERKESKHNPKDSQQVTREEGKRRKEKKHHQKN